MSLFFCLHAEKLKKEKRSNKKPKQRKKKTKLQMYHCQCSCTPLTAAVPYTATWYIFFTQEISKNNTLWAQGTYIRALHSSPKSILTKPSSPEHDTSGQDRNHKRSHASICSCNTFRAREVNSLKVNLSHQIKPRNGGSSSSKPHWPPFCCFRQPHPSLSASPACPLQQLRHSNIYPVSFSRLLGRLSQKVQFPDQKGCSTTVEKWRRGNSTSSTSLK